MKAMGSLFLLLVILTPIFLLGVAGGLWGKRRGISVLIGFIIGLLAILSISAATSSPPFPLSWEMVFGLLFFYVIPAVLGSLVGHAMRVRFPDRKPLGLTILLSILSALGFAMILPALNSSGKRPPRADCASNLRQIGFALANYADDYQGQLPPERGARGLDHLREFVNSPKVFHCPKDQIRHEPRRGDALSEDTVSYVYDCGAGTAGKNPLSVGKNIRFTAAML